MHYYNSHKVQSSAWHGTDRNLYHIKVMAEAPLPGQHTPYPEVIIDVPPDQPLQSELKILQCSRESSWTGLLQSPHYVELQHYNLQSLVNMCWVTVSYKFQWLPCRQGTNFVNTFTYWPDFLLTLSQTMTSPSWCIQLPNSSLVNPNNWLYFERLTNTYQSTGDIAYRILSG